ncbi:hypothetical protein [Fibrivirga algicola]|uniref:Holin n=1 Tax=Fibrivirga algicola TaxID=2950420 RepID=A0ABX0QJ69_9BACT|nr:hypothetical protein [Fibrivirga algicola]NID12505.1 hypothetical protein [Fibrivirga algicola]
MNKQTLIQALPYMGIALLLANILAKQLADIPPVLDGFITGMALTMTLSRVLGLGSKKASE